MFMVMCSVAVTAEKAVTAETTCQLLWASIPWSNSTLKLGAAPCYSPSKKCLRVARLSRARTESWGLLEEASLQLWYFKFGINLSLNLPCLSSLQKPDPEMSTCWLLRQEKLPNYHTGVYLKSGRSPSDGFWSISLLPEGLLGRLPI